LTCPEKIVYWGKSLIDNEDNELAFESLQERSVIISAILK